jgi:hypothetical protein
MTFTEKKGLDRKIIRRRYNMLYRYKRLLLVLLSVLSLSLMGAAITKHREKFQRTYDMEPGTKLDVYNINGKIEVSKWEKDKLEVIAIKETSRGKEELDKVKIEVTTNGDIEVKTVYLDKRVKALVHYEVKVPGNVVLRNIESSNGLIYIDGTKGPSVLKTSNGRIEVKDVDGDLNLHTSNGAINVENARGFVNAGTSNGSIDIKETEGISKVKNSNGSIKVEIPNIRGDIIDLVTSNGSIDVYIDIGLDVDIEMDTSNGRIKLHDIEMILSEIEKTYVKGRLGKGGTKINIRTSNGSIDLYKL